MVLGAWCQVLGAVVLGAVVPGALCRERRAVHTREAPKLLLRCAWWFADFRTSTRTGWGLSGISCVERVDGVRAVLLHREPMMRVGAVGNRVLCGFPRSGGRVLCVHGSGSVHALVHF